MKTRAFLLASAAVASLVTSVDAAERRMSLGGYFHGFAVAGRHDEGPGEPNQNSREHWIAREAEIFFDGAVDLDNGLKVGLRVELESESCADQIDESYVSFEGRLGRMLLGATNGAPYRMAVLPRSALPGHGFSDPRFFHGQSGPNTVGRSGPLLQNLLAGDNEKAVYFTPRIAGLQLGVSYTPDRCEESGCGGSYGGGETDNDANQQSEIFELGAHYARRVAEVELALSGGWSRSGNENPSAGMKDQEEWSAGASLAWSGFTLAAAYHQDDRGRRGRGDRDDVGASLHYAAGPWTFSLGGVRTTAQEAAGGEDRQVLLEAAGSYALGPGVLASLGLQSYQFEDELDAPGAENDALYVVGGLTLAF